MAMLADLLSDDEDEYERMEVDDPYLSNDEDMLTDDEEEEVVTVLRQQPTNNNQPSGSYDHDVDQLLEQFGKVAMKEIEQLESVKFNVRDFPEEYLFLLDMPAITESALRQHSKLFDLLMSEPTTITSIIDKQAAVICLYWAQAILDCARSLLSKVQLKLQDAFEVRSKFDKKRMLFQVRFKVEYDPRKCNGREPKKGMTIYFKTKEGRKFSTKVTKVEGCQCFFFMRTALENRVEYMKLENEIVDIYEVPQEFIPVSMIRSIRELRSGFLNSIILPSPKFSEEPYQYRERKEKEIDDFMEKYEVSTTLTSSQKDAVFAICNKEWPFVVWGPPGTGKTHTISEVIQTILKMNDSNRVLVCTPSNMASDHVAEQLMLDFGKVLNEKNVLRLRSTGNNYYLRDRKFDKIISCDPDNEVYKIPKQFTQWRVVICTLGASTHLVNTEMLTGFFSHIIVDEAGQCAEPELWIPLGGLATPNTSIVLCGDPKQLGPVIPLDLSNNLKKKFVAPLIRYMEDGQYKADKRLCCQLVDCFRCHPSLVSIISVLFYEKKLLPMVKRPIKFDFMGLDMREDFPILFISANGEEMRQPGGNSFCNTLEADICLAYANYFIEKKNVLPDQIGIISPYTYQSRTIWERASEKKNAIKLRQITVSSVERFQGSEREVIIISATRTRGLGFMADDLRVNTSLTRAKNLLIVVGNEFLLRRHDSWRQFIMYCEENDAIKYWDPKVDPQFASNESHFF